MEGDVPVPGNWTDTHHIAIWRPADGTWRIKDHPYNPIWYWGTNGDIPVPNDQNAGAFTDWSIWRPPLGMWRIYNNTSWGDTTNWTYYWGTMGDVPRCRRNSAIKSGYYDQ